VRTIQSIEQALLGVHLSRSCVVFGKDFNRNAAGDLSALVATHAICHNGEPAHCRELSVVGWFPVAGTVFIILAVASDVSQMGKFHAGADFHQRNGSKSPELYAITGLTFVRRLR
jgi:hypothetical protein